MEIRVTRLEFSWKLPTRLEFLWKVGATTVDLSFRGILELLDLSFYGNFLLDLSFFGNLELLD